MNETYLVYILDRGFISFSGSYVSNWKDAAHYTRDEAIQACKARTAPLFDNNITALPVRMTDIQAVFA